MAAFGGGGAGGGGGQGGKGPWQRGGDGAGLPGLIPGFPGAAPPGAGGPPPFVQGIPGLAGHLPPGHPGAANPVVTMAGQPGVYANPRLGPPGFQANVTTAAGHAQMLQHQAGALAALQQHQQQQQLQQQAKQGQGNPQTRVFTGIVTKYVGPNSGFVDNEVFFQTKDVKGHIPKENDRVLVEAYYNATMPFKWNASSLQLLPGTMPGSGSGGGAGGSAVGATGAAAAVRQQQQPAVTNQRSVNQSATLNTLAFGGGGSGGGGGGMPQHPPPPKYPGRDNRGGGGMAMDRGGGGGGGGGRNVSDNLQSKMQSAGNKQDRNNRRDGAPTIGRIGEGRGAGDSTSSSSRDRHGDSRDRDSRGRGASPPPRKRSRSPTEQRKRQARSRTRSRSRSPPRRRQRTSIPRYSVSVPKIPLNFPSSCVADLRKRYTNMYIPSDFFNADHVWNDSFPAHQPFKFQYGSEFHIFNKEQVELPVADPDAVFDPSDADHAWNAKVMLMAVPPPDDLYIKTCQMGESTFHNKDSLVHPTRAIQFLVGVRGGSKDNAAAIGGSWSPSLDGPDPGTNPATLVKTAIRTCKALTGIDLSGCTKWCRFLEIHYRRQETSTKPQRTETTVVYLPDVWSCMPSKDEHAKIEEVYAEALEAKINPKKPEVVAATTTTAKKAGAAKDEAKAGDADDDEEELDEQEKELMKSEMEEDEAVKADDKKAEAGKDEEENKVEEKMEEGGEAAEEENKGTHWKELDPKSMKVIELRNELEARGLNSKGVKSQLVVRLQKALKQEEEKEKEDTPDEPSAEQKTESTKDDATTSDDKMETDEGKEEEKEAGKAESAKGEESKKESEDGGSVIMEAEVMDKKKKEEVVAEVAVKPALDEKQKAALTAAYKLPEKPSILVHPHPKAKSGKFDCALMSLSVLLDYRTDDNKEGTFEVSLFAELFNEMLMRDSAFKLYRALTDLTPAVAALAAQAEAEKKTEDPSASAAGADDDNSSTSGGGATATTNASSALKGKLVTRNKELLMACSYFDLGHGGYIEKKDVEDILQATTLSLSRAQIKKLVAKAAAATTPASSKDQRLNYRLFTDKPENEEPKPMEFKSEEEEKQIALGFAAYLPGKEHQSANNGQEVEGAATAATSGICSYKGTVVDIGKLMAQLERAKQEKFDSESRLETTQQIVANLKESAEKHINWKEKCQNEVKDLKKKLRATEEDLKKAQTENFKFMNTINHVYNRVSPIATCNIANLQKAKAEAEAAAKQEQPEVKPDGGAEEPNHTNGTAATSSEDVKPAEEAK